MAVMDAMRTHAFRSFCQEETGSAPIAEFKIHECEKRGSAISEAAVSKISKAASEVRVRKTWILSMNVTF